MDVVAILDCRGLESSVTFHIYCFNATVDKCIGCKMCMNACPLGNISFHPTLRKVFKCDLCGGDPECAKFCPSGAIQFVETDADSDRRAFIGERFKELIGEEK